MNGDDHEQLDQGETLAWIVARGGSWGEDAPAAESVKPDVTNLDATSRGGAVVGDNGCCREP